MKTVLFIGQAPARPTSKHAIPGTYLHAWLTRIGLSDTDISTYCHFYALTDTFPGSAKGSHLAPTKEQIAAHRSVLVDAIKSIRPEIVVPVGKLAIRELIGHRDISLEETVGQRFLLDPFEMLGYTIPCIPLSHPSGISAWNHIHKEIVEQALALLQRELFSTSESTI